MLIDVFSKMRIFFLILEKSLKDTWGLIRLSISAVILLPRFFTLETVWLFLINSNLKFKKSLIRFELSQNENRFYESHK